MSRKVGVITLHNSPNYGSCLQTYATQVVLARVGADAEIIDYYRKDAIPENEVDRALNGQLVKKMPIFKVLASSRLQKYLFLAWLQGGAPPLMSLGILSLR